MSDRVAVILTNYNMPERTDALVEHFRRHVRWPHDWFVVDNASDLVAPSRYTNVQLDTNRQTTGGWLVGLKYAQTFGEDYLAYLFLITSTEIPEMQGDILTPLASWMRTHAGAVGMHPALTRDSTTSWGHLLTHCAPNGVEGANPVGSIRLKVAEVRQTWMIDNICSLWRAEWFDKIGWFDPRLVYGWGVDLETCWKARRDGLGIFVDERVQVKKVTDIGYQMDRMGMTANERRKRAGKNMQVILSGKYGPYWWEKMTEEYVHAGMH